MGQFYSTERVKQIPDEETAKIMDELIELTNKKDFVFTWLKNHYNSNNNYSFQQCLEFIKMEEPIKFVLEVKDTPGSVLYVIIKRIFDNKLITKHFKFYTN
jgi:hypothetical protein